MGADQITTNSAPDKTVPTVSSTSITPEGKTMEVTSEQVREGVIKEVIPQVTEKIKKEIETVRKESEEKQLRSTEVLGVFVALFTFVSLEFQLVRTFDYLNFLFLSLFIAGLLIFFVLALHVVIHDKFSLKAMILLFVLMVIYGGLAIISNAVNPTNTRQSKTIDIEKVNINQLGVPQK